MAVFMTPASILMLQKIMDHCHDRLDEACKTSGAPSSTPGVLTGKKMAYNDVLQYARKLLTDGP